MEPYTKWASYEVLSFEWDTVNSKSVSRVQCRLPNTVEGFDPNPLLRDTQYRLVDHSAFRVDSQMDSESNLLSSIRERGSERLVSH